MFLDVLPQGYTRLYTQRGTLGGGDTQRGIYLGGTPGEAYWVIHYPGYMPGYTPPWIYQLPYVHHPWYTSFPSPCRHVPLSIIATAVCCPAGSLGSTPQNSSGKEETLHRVIKDCQRRAGKSAQSETSFLVKPVKGLDRPRVTLSKDPSESLG